MAVYLDDQKIDVVQGGMLPNMPTGKHRLKVCYGKEVCQEISFTLVEGKQDVPTLVEEKQDVPVSIDFGTLKPPEPLGRKQGWCSYLSAFWDDQTREERGHTGRWWIGNLVIKTREDWIQHWYKTVEAWERDPYIQREYLPNKDDPPPDHIMDFSSNVVNFAEKDLLVVFETGGGCAGGYVESIKDIQLLDGTMKVKFSYRALNPYSFLISNGGDACHIIQINNNSYPIEFQNVSH